MSVTDEDRIKARTLAHQWSPLHTDRTAQLENALARSLANERRKAEGTQ